jgi:hypothetical protein
MAPFCDGVQQSSSPIAILIYGIDTFDIQYEKVVLLDLRYPQRALSKWRRLPP